MTRRPATHGILDQVHAEWRARGWDPAVLDSFRMEGGTGGDGGDGGGQGRDGSGGGQGGNQPPATPPASAGSGGGPSGADLTQLQQQIDAAKAAGGSEALKPFMAMVGAKDETELRAKLEEWKQADEGRKSEAQRALEAQQRAEQQAEEATAGKTASDVALLKTHALMRAGMVDPDQITTVIDMVKIDGDPTPETATAAVEQLKGTFPQLFTPAQDPAGGSKTPPAPHSVPPRPGTQNPPATGVDAGRERAKREKERRQVATRDDLLASFAPKPSPFAN